MSQSLYGVCGPAAIIMSLLQAKKIDPLVDCVFNGGDFLGVRNAKKNVAMRIKKRETAGIFASLTKIKSPEVEFDAKLAIGLLILLKEHLKDSEQGKIWEACIECRVGLWAQAQRQKRPRKCHQRENGTPGRRV